MFFKKGEILGTPSSSPTRKKNKNRGVVQTSLPRLQEPPISGETDPQTGEDEEGVLEISGGTERRRRTLANGNGCPGVPVARPSVATRAKLETSDDSRCRMLSHLLQNILSSLNPARIGKAAPLRGRRVTKTAKKGKASQGRWNPGRIWGLAMVASLSLNLILVVVLVMFLYKGHGVGLGTCAAGAAKESKMAAAAPPMVQDKEDMPAGQEIAVSATSGTRPVSKDSLINLDHGDPTMFESFWRWMGDRGSIVIPAWQTMSYFSDVTNDCWFLEPEFAQEVRRLHNLIGNAVTEDRYIVVGTGSTQLFQAALYALSPSNASEPINVVSAAPYYSSYPAVTGYLRSGLFQWAGDAYTYNGDKYIELVCSPNNPDGSIREAVLNSEAGKTIHDLAYYWPQYTPISSPADHDIMLFTVSKCTGHAGTRLGWAIVKDKDVAKKMVKFIELNTIGVSKDSQLRAAKILKVVSDGYELPNTENTSKLFDFGRRLMTMRWEKLREAVKASGIFSLPEFPSSTCKFTGERTGTNPAFAWLKCEKEGIEDCESFLRSYGMLTRSGRHFGVEPKYVRVSMLDRDETFELFVERLSSLN